MEALPLPNQEAGTVAGKLVDEVFLCFPSQTSYIQIKAYSLSPSLWVTFVNCSTFTKQELHCAISSVMAW